MLCFGSKDAGKSAEEIEKDRKKSKAIEQEIRAERVNQDNHIKLLLLGTGDSGKSTFAKQIKLIYLNGFKKRETEAYRKLIRLNVIKVIRTLLNAADKMGLSLAKENKGAASTLLGLSTETMSEIESLAEYELMIKRVWSDPAMKKVWTRSNEFQTDTCGDYLLDNASRICRDDYQPTHDDILRVRRRTTGILQIQFEVKGISFTMVDVGGQRSERRKWLHCFDDVNAIVYFVALNEYDMKLFEDERVNRMKESLELFQEISSSKWFKDTCFIIFLNKSDLFKDKISKSPLSKLFPDYDGGDNYDKAVKYIKEQFSDCFNGNSMYTYVTCALSTENVREVFDSVRDVIVKHNANRAGL